MISLVACFLSFLVALLGLAYMIGTLSDDDKANIVRSNEPDALKGNIAADALYTMGCGVSIYDILIFPL